MAAKSTAFAVALLKLAYQAVAWANVADNAASAPLTNIYAGLATADPGVGGDQTTSETTYTGYARQAIPRSTSGFNVSAGGVLNPVNNVVFPQSTSGTPTCPYMTTGTAATGTGVLWHRWPISGSLTVSTAVPQTVTNGSTLAET